MKISYSYNTGQATAKLPQNSSKPEWIFVPHSFTPLPPDRVLIRSRLSDANTVITNDVYGALEHCQSFRSLQEHARVIGHKIPALNDHQAQIVATLQQLADSGLMVEKNAFFDGLSLPESSQSAESPIEQIFIRTCDRPNALERLLTSLAASGILENSALRIIVIDNSRQADNRARNLQLTQDVSSSIEYFGANEQAVFTAALADKMPQYKDSIEFLLGGTNFQDTVTPGIPLNYALLLAAGNKMAVLDDDAIFQTFAPMISDTGLTINSGDRTGRLAASDHDWSNPATIDSAQLLANYSQALGTPLNQFIQTNQADSKILDDAVLADLELLDKDSRILITGCGVVGDPGTGSNAWVYAMKAEYLDQLADSKDAYDTAVLSRNAWMGVSRLTIQPDYSLMTTTLTGLNNEQLIPPTIPEFRNEDMILGTLTSTVHPTALKLEYPVALAHLPIPRRTWDRKSTADCFNLSVGAFIPDLIKQRARDIGSQTPEDRLQSIAAQLKDFGNSGYAVVRNQLLDHLIRHHHEIARSGMDILTNTPPSKTWVAEDFQHSVKQEIDAIQSQAGLNFGELKALGELPKQINYLTNFIGKFGMALACWPQIRAAAIELRGQKTR